jgi:hypothetical protein
MDSIWNVAPQIGTGLSLVAFVVAVGLYAYRARLKQRASVIAKMPARDRLAAIDATAEFLRVDVSGLSEKDKHDIVVRQLAIRARRELMLAGIAIAVALLLGAVAIISIVAEPRQHVARKCYRFDPQSGEPNKTLGERPCFPGKLVYLKYWDPNNYDPSWPSDRPNRVFQAKGTKRDVLEFAFPRDILTQLSSGNTPTVRMRWVRVSCSQEIGSNPLVGPAFIDTRWPIVAAVTDPT